MLEQQISRWIARQDDGRSISVASDLPVVLATDIGCSRKENQDRVAAMRVHAGYPSNISFVCVAVCDGMGGMSDGGASATLALSSFLTELVRQRRLRPEEKLKSSIEYANAQVFNFVKAKGGATLSAVLLEDGKAFSANVGDSRIYVDRTNMDERCLERATVDDNLSEAFGGHGKELVQFVGIGEGISPHIKALPEQTKSFILTTDGVHFIDEKVFSKVFLIASDLRQGVERLMDIAEWHGGPDNATIAAFDLEHFLQFPLVHEGGHVELWNAFGNLQLMWANKEDEDQNLPSSKARVEVPVNIEEKDAKATRKPPRKRAKKKKKLGDESDLEQFEIDIRLGEEEG
ncbi:MAG: protein phosphatase 2C domain-containing protein [Rhodospirillales bacterium]|nr:protein phosphatase 2C domain-containing protein [Rhodospirillales bacterium]